METKSIEVSNLKFAYGNSIPILDIPKFEVQKKEKVFLFGPSGSGKTTLLEMLAGVLTPQSGQVVVEGSDMGRLSPQARDSFRAQKLGYIFQNFNLLPFLTVSENIDLGIIFNPEKRQFSVEKKKEILKRLGLLEFENRKARDLSVGQQQRIALARVLWMEPELVLADEPTSALDWEHREKFIEILFELKNSSVVFVSHDRSLEKLFDRSVSLIEINQVKK